MPMALDPSLTFTIVLKSDAGKSPAPAFRFRYPSGRQWLRVAETIKTASADGESQLRVSYDLLRLAMVGWENMTTTDAEVAKEFGVRLPTGKPAALPYKPELLDVLLNPRETAELLKRFGAEITPDNDAKNELGSQSPSPTAPPASSAPAAGA